MLKGIFAAAIAPCVALWLATHGLSKVQPPVLGFGLAPSSWVDSLGRVQKNAGVRKQIEGRCSIRPLSLYLGVLWRSTLWLELSDRLFLCVLARERFLRVLLALFGPQISCSLGPS